MGRYLCDECGKSYSHIQGLSRHKHKHRGTYTCKYCNKSLSTNSILQHHIQICSAKTDNLKERITKLKILETLRLGKNIFDILNQNKDICVEQLSDDHKQALEFYLHKQALEFYLSIPSNF